ncbi:MAG: cysteine synthase [Bacteroidetes bacterium HGW-Bacteroidetes-12]|nr:MAG: cysteine synthase [Bacteroidetes bacterium HGW-Bacteroidetes-12]
MQEDLKTFIEIANKLFEDEQHNPVVFPINPNELSQHIDLTLNDNPIAYNEFLETLTKLVLQTPKTSSKLFFNQLFGGRQSKAVLGDLLSILLNNSMYTYKVAGPQIGVEKEIINKICNIVGYEDGSGGTFTVGGSMSNFMGMLMARDAANLKIREQGFTKPLIAYTSIESHYSIIKSASFIGMGKNNLRFISTNEKGEMLTSELEKQILEDIANGYTPFFVNATAGTTVLGVFDPIDEISKVCKRYNLWLHVDGAYCGGVIFSKKHKSLINGLEKSDSFNFNAHKMLGTPLVCSVIVVKNKKHLYNSFSVDADYLYQTDGDDFNLGKTSFQCGRKNEALKLWTLWKSVGTFGLEKMVNHLFDLSKFAYEYVNKHPDYTVYSSGNSLSICFNYKGIDASNLCTALYEDAKLVVGFGNFREDKFIRLVTVNANNTEADILNFFKELEGYVDSNELTLRTIKKVVS